MKQRKQTKTLAAFLLTGLFVTGAQAQDLKSDGWYGEVGYLGMKFTGDTSLSPKPKMARFVVGKDINPNLSVEGMVGLTVSKDSWSDSGESGKISGTTYGVFVKPKYEFAPGFQVFARVGVAYIKWKDDYTSGSTSGSESDSATKFAYGLGIQADLTKDVYTQLDYMKYGSKDVWTAKGFAVSLGMRF